MLALAPLPAPTKAFAKEGRSGRFKVQAGECCGPALEVKADLLPSALGDDCGEGPHVSSKGRKGYMVGNAFSSQGSWSELAPWPGPCIKKGD